MQQRKPGYGNCFRVEHRAQALNVVDESSGAVSPVGLSWLENACLGGGIPAEAELQLKLAGLAYQQDEVAEAHLKKAAELAPGHAAVLIGWYRFYFYKGRLREALGVAEQCLGKAAVELGLAPDWRDVKQDDANFGSFEAILPRFYLFTLKGYAYLHMRLGELDEGRIAIAKIMELDPGDKMGASVLMKVLERMWQEDDD